MTALESTADLQCESASTIAKRLYFRSETGRAVVRQLAAKSASAERPLSWIALIHLLNTGIIFIFLAQKLARGDAGAQMVMAIHVVVTVAYWAIWTWSASSPLPAAIVGMLLLISMSMADYTAMGHAAFGHPGAPMGGSVPIFTLALLIRAIFNGWRHRVLELDAALEIGASRPHSRGILSPLLLYLVLLSIVLTPLGLAVDHDLTMGDLLDVHKLMAIIITTWALIAWRDTLPALARIGSIKWLTLAVVFGLGTFACASMYTDLLCNFSDIQRVRVSDPFLLAGFSWPMIFGIAAVFPAVFEELAFRGIMVPALARVLNKEETVAVTAIMFMILHLSVPSAPHLLLLGIGAAVLRLRSKSIWPCVLMHLVHNAMCIGFERWM
jgi:uncharacterized protein